MWTRFVSQEFHFEMFLIVSLAYQGRCSSFTYFTPYSAFSDMISFLWLGKLPSFEKKEGEGERQSECVGRIQVNHLILMKMVFAKHNVNSIWLINLIWKISFVSILPCRILLHHALSYLFVLDSKSATFLQLDLNILK